MANNPVRTKFETPTTLTITMNSIGTGAGRVSTQVDLDDSTLATAGENIQRVQLKLRVRSGGSAPTAGGTYEFYLIRSDGTDQDAAFGTTDAAWSDSTLRDQLEFIGAITVTNTASKDYYVTFTVYNPGKKFQIGFWNATSDNGYNIGKFYAKITPETDNIVA